MLKNASRNRLPEQEEATKSENIGEAKSEAESQGGDAPVHVEEEKVLLIPPTVSVSIPFPEIDICADIVYLTPSGRFLPAKVVTRYQDKANPLGPPKLDLVAFNCTWSSPIEAIKNVAYGLKEKQYRFVSDPH
jgi:hypothetical protein